MIDLGKNGINEDENQEVKQEPKEEVVEQVNQVAISEVEPTKQVNNVVTNVNLNKTVPNKQYDIFELIGLAFKLVNKNIGKFVMCSVGSLLSFLIFGMPISMTMTDMTTFNLDKIWLIVTMVILFLICVIIWAWLLTKAITSIDTGIERIESQKSNVPMGTSFWRICGLQLLLSGLSISIYALVGLTSGAVFIYAWLMIQMQIFTFLLSSYMLFGYFEIVAKGENVSNSLANSFTNLFFSKNGIILKSFVGGLIFGLILLVLTFIMIFVLAFSVTFAGALGSGFGIGILLTMAIILIMCYVWYISMTYTYLVYMLNEVRDDKVGDLR